MPSEIAAARPPLRLGPDDGPHGARPEAVMGDAIDQLGPEVAALLREGMELERQGHLDTEATARIEARLQAIYEAQQRVISVQQQHQQAIKDPDAQSPRHKDAYERWTVPKVLWTPFLAAGVAGLLLEVTVGRGFIWLGNVAYSSTMPVSLLVLFTVLAVVLYLDERANHSLRSRHPTGWVRWLVMYPTLVVFCAGLVAFAPWGWAAAIGWAVGMPSRVDVRVASVQVHDERKRNCNQSAQLEFKGATARICLDGRLAGPVPAAGETVAVSGRVSLLGLHVREIHVK